MINNKTAYRIGLGLKLYSLLKYSEDIECIINNDQTKLEWAMFKDTWPELVEYVHKFYDEIKAI